MGDRAGRATRRVAQANVDVDIVRDLDGGESESGSSDGEIAKEVVRGGINHIGLFRRWQWIPECG